MFERLLILSLFVAITWPASSLADPLGGDAIRAVYKSLADAGSDPEKTVEFLQTGLADEYILDQTITYDFGKGQNKKIEQTISKAQILETLQSSSRNEKIEKYANTVDSIAYSPDKSFAIVNATTTVTKTINVAGANNQYSEAHSTQKQTCVDFLAWFGDSIKFVKSQCTETIAITQ